MDRKPEITENTSLPQSKGLHIKRNLELDIKRRIETAEFVQHLPTSIHAPTEELRQSSMIIAEMRSYLEQLRNEENLPPVLQRTINAIGQETINDERFLLQVAREEALLYDDFETPLRYRQQRRLEILPTALRHAHAIYTFSRQYKDALRDQYIDQLTGLRNRRCINELIFPQTQLHISRGEQTSLVIVDLDEFKQINDQLGHQVGDEVIKAVAKILQAGTRQTDQVARYGGDEILIVLPFTEANEALDIAQRILANTNQSLEVVFPDGSKKPVTLTMGISSSNGRKDLTSQELFQEADKALYAAKRDGRNRVYNYDPQSMENLDTNVPLPRD